MTDASKAADIATFSTAWFETDDLGIAMRRALEQHDGDIVRAADTGEPPVAVLAPALNDMISEGICWRWLDRAIEQRLAADFAKVDRKWVGLTGLPRGRCYRRIATSCLPFRIQLFCE